MYGDDWYCHALGKEQYGEFKNPSRLWDVSTERLPRWDHT
jgi:hypothetical protein